MFKRFGMSIAAVAVTVSPAPAQKPRPAAQAPDVALYDAVLQKYVTAGGKVNYGLLKNDSAKLGEFISQIGSASPDSAPALFPNREAQLAYWLNAYNALVLQSFAAEYPQKRERLTSLLGRASFFARNKHRVGGKERTLSDIEDNTVRKLFREPRIHFALVCASASCPWLSRTAYTPANLNAQLEAEAARYFAQPRNFQMDEAKREVTIPRIMEWFKDDFGGSPDRLLAFIARYRKDEAAKLTQGTWRIKYFEYDWSPNDVR
jgi:hypothetical protein